MNIRLVHKARTTSPLYSFLDEISGLLRIKIFNKLHSYSRHGGVYRSKSLKTLNARIWGYKGTIYKLRVDSDKESARVLFSKSRDGDLVVIHAFLKTTRKTPKKDARQAITIYQSLGRLETVMWDEPSLPASSADTASGRV